MDKFVIRLSATPLTSTCTSSTVDSPPPSPAEQPPVKKAKPSVKVTPPQRETSVDWRSRVKFRSKFTHFDHGWDEDIFKDFIVMMTGKEIVVKKDMLKTVPKEVDFMVPIFKTVGAGEKKRQVLDTDKMKKEGVEKKAFDNRAYMGKVYSWEAFIDERAPCSLTCRASGFRFFATLNKSVIDGTSCDSNPFATKRCISGICMSQPSLVSTFYEDFSSSERVERAIFLQRTDEKESEDFFTSDGLHKIAQCNPCRLCELLGSYFTQGSVSSLIKRSIRQYDGRLNH
ncbi:Thrombospondin type-1 domain-containing protein 4 [Folsomia candida]|uniref:Thrombospondin type-1 domain-containing protein 4 n=1 Tax=Folsomia candida TaxID=158441 RepID=A0A226EUQ1_FOLCA|nr:Thrombospondin type-1 domain-containing protein 4 [Folsomia candida]